MKQYDRRPVASVPNTKDRSCPAIDPLESEAVEEPQPVSSVPMLSSV